MNTYSGIYNKLFSFHSTVVTMTNLLGENSKIQFLSCFNNVDMFPFQQLPKICIRNWVRLVNCSIAIVALLEARPIYGQYSELTC